jgi:hypothetical protein
VSGIGERTYRAIADRLAVVAPEELLAPLAVAPEEESEEMAEPLAERAAEEEISFEAEVAPEQEMPSDEEVGSEAKAPSLGEPMPEGELIFEEQAEFAPGIPMQAGPEPEHAMGETLPEAGDAPEADDVPEKGDVFQEVVEVGQPGAQEVSAEEAVAEVEEATSEERAVAEAVSIETDLPPAHVEERREPAPSRSWWRRLSWLWTALLGGLLGMAFTLLVFSGINGSLDIAHSRAVVGVSGRMDSLATDINSLQSDVGGLRQRLQALEDLTVRMDRAEAAVGDLQEESLALRERTEGLEESVAAFVKELEAVSEQVETLGDQVEQTRSFFQALQTLLNEFFGEAEGDSSMAPTPIPEGS